MGLFLNIILCSAYTGGDEAKRCMCLSRISCLVRAAYTCPPRTAQDPRVFSKQRSAAHLISLLLSTSSCEARTLCPDALQSLLPLLTTPCFHSVGVSSTHFSPLFSISKTSRHPGYHPGHFAKSLSLVFPGASQTRQLLKGVLHAQEKRSGETPRSQVRSALSIPRPPPVPGTAPAPPAALTPSRGQCQYSLPAGIHHHCLFCEPHQHPTASGCSIRQLVPRLSNFELDFNQALLSSACSQTSINLLTPPKTQPTSNTTSVSVRIPNTSATPRLLAAELACSTRPPRGRDQETCSSLIRGQPPRKAAGQWPAF